MDHMGYRFASGQGKDRFPVLIARDSALSAESLRTAIALFNHLADCDGVATVADIARATGLSAERAQSALAALRAAGYVESDSVIVDPSRATRPARQIAPGAQRRRRPGKGGRLEPGIMDYELDIDGLIRAGDANIRDAGTRASPTHSAAPGGGGDAGDGTGAANWGTLMGEQNQPVAMRFMVWLRFVLGPDELAACDRFALAHKDRWKAWITRFSQAKAAGAESELLDDIRCSLNETAGGEAAPKPPALGPRPPRPN
jgi:hypothetical protein